MIKGTFSIKTAILWDNNVPNANTICIYKILNTQTGEFYIGQSSNVRHRMSEHFSRKGSSGSLLKANIKKYGYENFRCIILERCSKEMLTERETFLIKMLLPHLNISLTKKINLSICTNNQQKNHFARNGKASYKYCVKCRKPCANRDLFKGRSIKQFTLLDVIR